MFEQMSVAYALDPALTKKTLFLIYNDNLISYGVLDQKI